MPIRPAGSSPADDYGRPRCRQGRRSAGSFGAYTGSCVPQLMALLGDGRGCLCSSAAWGLVDGPGIPSGTTLAGTLPRGAGPSMGSGGTFVKTSTRRNCDGSKVTYLQLAHNEWDLVAKTSRTKVLYSLGRADELNRAAIERLIASLTRCSASSPPPRLGRRGRAQTGCGWRGSPGWRSPTPARSVGCGCWTGCGANSGSTPCWVVWPLERVGIRSWSG